MCGGVILLNSMAKHCLRYDGYDKAKQTLQGAENIGLSRNCIKQRLTCGRAKPTSAASP